MLKRFAGGIITLINITLIVLTFLVALVAIFSPDTIKNIIDWLEVVIQGLGSWNYLIAGSSAMIESFPILGMALPGQTVLLLVGGFFGQDYLFYLILVACLGAIIGNYIGFVLGYYTGDSFFRKYGEWFGIGETELDYIKSGIHKYGPFAVIISKFHPMTRAFIPFIAGSMGMKQFSFIIYNIIGSIIWAITIVILGVMFVSYYEVVIDNIVYIMLAIFSLIALYIYIFKKEEFKEYLKRKEEEIQRKANKKN